ncbi:MAG TPA: hypothetical protein VLS45_03490, partial [Methylomicrobium sp.]|nr:hypothetical protein [Methylomicrobium sp.]
MYVFEKKTYYKIEMAGWKNFGKQEAAYQFWKKYDNGIEVVVEIKQDAAGYFVLSRAEHRCTEPCESAAGTAASIEAALEITNQCCED